MPPPSDDPLKGAVLTGEARSGAEHVCRVLVAAGHRALLAGGCVRDMLLGVAPRDYDVATDARPEQVARLFKRTIPVGAAYGVQIVVLSEGQFEVATFREDGPYLDGRHPLNVRFTGEEQDARRRDFTINAMFYDPVAGCVVDYVGGQEDLRQGVIRTVGDPRARFAEDHLRLLRALRFSARFNYAIVPDTYAALREMTPLIASTSAERIRDELLKMFTETTLANPAARRALELLDASGLLVHVLPEVARLKGVEQPPEFHPEGDVFIHTGRMIELMEKPTATLALAALLHDVGKPATQTYEDRIRFNFHEKIGAMEAESVCRRLRLSNDQIERVVWLVEQHMRLARLADMRESKRKRFVREPGFWELIELCRLDCLASHGDLDVINWVKDYAANLPPDAVRPAPLLRGDDLIAMGYRPGPLFTEIMRAIEDAQLEGELRDADHARAFVRERWPLP